MTNKEQQKEIKYFETRAEQLKELKQTCADFQEKMDSVSYHDEMEDMRSMVSNMFSYLEKRISWAEEDLYSFISRHLSGHIPAIRSVSQMEKALEVLGLDKEVEIYKPVITIATHKKNKVFEVELTKTPKSDQ